MHLAVFLILSVVLIYCIRAQTDQSSRSATASLMPTAQTSLRSDDSLQSQHISNSIGVCEARRVNVIKFQLSQSCPTGSFTRRPSFSATNHVLQLEQTQASLNEQNIDDGPESNSAAAAFLSFEDWKEITLRRAGQDPQIWRSRKPSQRRHDENNGDASANFITGLGEEGEISLDFGHYETNFGYNEAEMSGGEELSDDKKSHQNSAISSDDYSGRQYAGNEATISTNDPAAFRSEDAGKTCKERFSYSSFDAGATVLKSASGAKNARAILVENKDSYMLLACAAPSKYVIVELSDDILIDTIVLANFEFYSSMIRHFRVSVSDRYPVKGDNWRELGTFEARNSRDLQPFLVENPQMWAKYLKIDFLSHHGNEYYCPVSLLRVHGSRMLDSWKDSETGRQDDILLDASDLAVDQSTTAASIHSLPSVSSTRRPLSSAATRLDQCFIQSALLPYDRNPATCPAEPAAVATNWPSTSKLPQHFASSHAASPYVTGLSMPARNGSSDSKVFVDVAVTAVDTLPALQNTFNHPDSDSSSTLAQVSSVADTIGINSVKPDGTVSSHTASNASYIAISPTTDASANTNHSPNGGKSRGSGSYTSGLASPSSTVHEGFFNAITKRLQQVESNLTLSLKYVEEQSRHLREALVQGEQKHYSTVSSFLRNLNQTVFAELHQVRDQYHHLWQLTVLAIDSQADRAERDIISLSTRLNLLADEVVFQKRLAMVQALILLSCLFLVIFSRNGVPLPASFAYPPSGHPVYTLTERCNSPSSTAHPVSEPSHHRQNPYSALSTIPNSSPRLPATQTNQSLDLSNSNSRKPLPSLPEHSSMAPN